MHTTLMQEIGVKAPASDQEDVGTPDPGGEPTDAPATGGKPVRCGDAEGDGGVKKRISNLKSKIHKPEIVLANDPSGAFSRQLGKLAGWPPADLAGSGEKRSRRRARGGQSGVREFSRPGRAADDSALAL